MKNKQAFTLIELLVVVLIIGILASIALPQYQKAVAKSRYSAMKALTQSIYQGEQVYFMANGVYTNRFEELDIDIGGTPSTNNSHATAFPWGSCWIELGVKYTYCKNNKLNMSYVVTFAGQRFCVAYGADTNSMNHQICKQETGTSSPYLSSSWYKYP